MFVLLADHGSSSGHSQVRFKALSRKPAYGAVVNNAEPVYHCTLKSYPYMIAKSYGDLQLVSKLNFGAEIAAVQAFASWTSGHFSLYFPWVPVDTTSGVRGW